MSPTEMTLLLEQADIANLRFPSDLSGIEGEAIQTLRAIVELQNDVLHALVDRLAA